MAMRAPVATGSVVAGYRIEAMVGEGAMGTVYVAEATQGQGRVALKLLAPELAQDERFRRRFLQESRVAASLDHPHIVPTIASGEEGGVLFLAMAHIDGSDLRQLLRREGALEPERALRLLGQVAQALDAAHEAGLVHRDVKPGNILVTGAAGGEHAYVCDFGLARHVSSVSSLTGERGFVGTIDYVPPEQIEGASIDQRADVYSLGCVLYECLAGSRPFDRDSELSVVFAHLVEPPPPITDRRPTLANGLDDVFATALAKSPANRYATCGQLIQAAGAALQGRPVRRSRRGRRTLVSSAALLVAGGVSAGLLLLSSHGSETGRASNLGVLPVNPDSVALVSADAPSVVRAFALQSAPGDVAFGRRSGWVLLRDRQLVDRLDPASGRVTGHVRLPFVPSRIAGAGETAWVTEDSGPRVAWIGRRPGGLGSLRVKKLFSVGTQGDRLSSPAGIAVGAGSLWIARGAHVARVDPRTGRVLQLFRTPVTSNWVVFKDGMVWAASGDSGSVYRIDPIANRITHQFLHGWISDLTVGDGYVWVPVVPENVVYKLSIDDLSLQGQVAAGPDPESVSVGGGALWIANTRDGVLTRIDIATGARRVVKTPSDPVSARYHDGLVWTAAAPAPPRIPPLASGQEIRIPLSRYDIGALDPAVVANADRWQRDYETCATLLRYPDSSGATGQELRPEIAAAMPNLSPDGHTYRFHIRPGFRFSPPSGEPVTAQTFRYSLERAFSPAYGSHSPAMQILPDVVGAAAYNRGRARQISGIRARGATLAITLRARAGDFPTRLSEAFFCPVPIGTPAVAGGLTRPIPSAGPYYVASSALGQTVLLRNPNYHGPRPRRIERIVYTVGTPTAKAIALIDGGGAEYIDGWGSDSDPAALATSGSAARRYGPSSVAAKRNGQRYFVTPAPGIDMIAFNTRRPLFRHVQMRRAVNFAIDRRALAGVFDEQPVDHYVPPAVAGSPLSHAYPLDGPNLARARRLAGTTHRTAVLYLCGEAPNLRVAQIIRGNLAPIGIHVRIDQSLGCLNGPEKARVRAADMQLVTISSSEPDASVWVKATLGTTYFSPGYWSDPKKRLRIERANRLRGQARTKEYARLDEVLVRDAAPFAAFGAFTTQAYFSPQVGCRLFQSTYHFVDLGALCVHRA
jgi:ABC-type transport system substrate-binding protein/tRNA A-37 threonylcarbamoyl transferase component Bud32